MHWRYGAWNVRVRSLWWAQPREPDKGGGGLGNRLGAASPPPRLELQWTPGPVSTWGLL